MNPVHRRDSMLEYTGLGKTTAHMRIQAGTFPPGFSVSIGVLGWLEHELDLMNAAHARGANDHELAALVEEIVAARHRPLTTDAGARTVSVSRA